MRIAFSIVVGIVFITSSVRGAEESIQHPEPAPSVTSKDLSGWRFWESLADLHGSVGYRERSTSIHLYNGEPWVGTSQGRLLSRNGADWKLEASFQGIQITGIAHQKMQSPKDEHAEDVVWLSTSEGMQRLAARNGAWSVTSSKTYYEGHPTFVSGSYIPGEDSIRVWGYVDGIYVPSIERSYSPLVISTEHGLFSGTRGIWHHFFPHYWGASSEWLDLRELIPHRRPMCIVELPTGDLFIGTDGDGIIQLAAHARAFCHRKADQNTKDGHEFVRHGQPEIGVQFDKVWGVAAGTDGSLLAALSDGSENSYIVRFVQGKWEAAKLPEQRHRQHHKGVWTTILDPALIPLCVEEIAPDRVMIGIDGRNRNGILELNWQTKEFRNIEEIKFPVTQLLVNDQGTVFALTNWGLFEKQLER